MLEVAETPPNPAGRALAWTIAAMTVFAVVWAYTGYVDVVAVAEGKTIPSGKSKVVQAGDSGVVTAIHVRDGQAVAAGDPLLDLDLTASAAEAQRLADELAGASVTAARLRAKLATQNPAEAERRYRSSLKESDPAMADGQIALLHAELAELRGRMEQLGDELRRRRAERGQIAAGLQRLDRTIPLLSERETARRELAERGSGSRLQWLEIRQQLIESEQERIAQRHRLEENDAAIAGLETQRASLVAEFRRTRTAELVETERKIAGLGQELVKANVRRALQSIVAPIDGVVQQLSVHTVSGFVQAGQALMVVVPMNERLEVEAKIQGRDIGFVYPGQSASVKVETFDFAKFGLIGATVESVSADSVLDDKTGRVHYLARVLLDRQTMKVQGRELKLPPGASVTVEVKLSERRVVDYLLSPIARTRQEAMRER